MKETRKHSVRVLENNFIMVIIFFIGSSDYDFSHTLCEVMNELFYLGRGARKKIKIDEML